MTIETRNKIIDILKQAQHDNKLWGFYMGTTGFKIEFENGSIDYVYSIGQANDSIEWHNKK